MDYEKAYKASLKTAAQWIKDGCTDKEKICLECVFPELRESEDERIRKAIVKSIEEDSSVYEQEVSKEQMLAYLEKQKEEEGYDAIPVESTLEYKLGFKAGKESERQKEQKPWKVGESAYFTPDKETPIVKKEQKPLTDFEAALYSYLSDDTSGKFSKEVMHKCAVERAKILLEIAKKEPKPVWADIPYCSSEPEWSEEDEDMLNCCISSIEEAKENRYAYKETDGDTSYDREIAWLKSLRPSWKPSEEQMSMLLAVINDPNNAGAESCYMALKGIYNNLKKLM